MSSSTIFDDLSDDLYKSDTLRGEFILQTLLTLVTTSESCDQIMCTINRKMKSCGPIDANYVKYLPLFAEKLVMLKEKEKIKKKKILKKEKRGKK